MVKSEIQAMFVKSAFFFMIGVILASLFVWTMVQGFLVHPTNESTAFVYYFIGWLSGVAAFVLYFQARGLFHYAKISN